MASSGWHGFFTDVIALLVVFCTPFWGFATLRSRWNLAYRDHVGGIAVYFLSWSLFDLWLFRSVLVTAPTNNQVVLPILIFIGTLFLAGGLYSIGQVTLPDVSASLQTYGRAYNEFARLDSRYLAAKSCEVFFQQVGLILSVLVLNSLLSAPGLTTLFVASLFGLAHLILYSIRYRQKRAPEASVLLFSSASFVGGGLMSLLILLVPFGLVYSFCIHELFYPFVGMGFRVLLSKQHTANESTNAAQSNLPL